MKYFIAFFAFAFISACTSTPTVKTILAEGGEIVEGGVGSLIGEDGATLTGVDGSWTVFLAPDGKKEVSIRHNKARETLSWRRKDDGTFCEIMYDTRREECTRDGVILVKSADGIYLQFTDGDKGKYPFRAASGNTNEL